MILGAGIIGETIPKETLVDYELIDEYEYPNIPYEMSNEYAETLSHIMNQYIENASIGKEYGQICLYKAFQSIKSEPYSVMDSMFQLIKERAKYNEEILPLYEDIKDSESYIDYMYKSLSKEGSSKITDDITSAVETYNSQVANYRELNAFGLLDKSEKSSIEKMEKMYGKQIKQLENEIEKDYGKEK